MVLERIATANPDCVIALPPSGLRTLSSGSSGGCRA